MSDNVDRVYYKIYFLKKIQRLTVVCMQWFDEYDYNESKFLRDDQNKIMSWDKEIDAVKYLNDNFKLEYIDEDYITANHPGLRIDGENEGEIPESLID